MKKMFIYKLMAVLITATIIIAACTKEQSDVRLNPRLSTSQLLDIKSDSATVIGFVVAEGSGFTEKGVCYDTATAPTPEKHKVIDTAQTTSATFKVILSGLDYATKYYARAYAIGAEGTVYGEELTFTTLPVIPTLVTVAITDITGNTATGGGNVTITGGAAITSRGICFGVNQNPTVIDNKTNEGTGAGAFVSTLTGLLGNTTYYVRAYAVNSAGTAYGPEISFTTMVDLPTVTTRSVVAITTTGARTGGNITYDGGAPVTARGLAWGANPDPTTSGNIIDGGAGSGAYVSLLTALDPNTVYHVRAYATNSAGTGYGIDIEFTTLADITKLWLVGDYNGWDNSDNALFIISTVTSGGAAEGYFYAPGSGGLKLTSDHSWDDPHTFGDNGSGALTNPGANIPVPAEGYYLVKANLGDMSYSLTLTTWGVIGDATPGAWDSQTDMVYDPVTKIFSLGLHMTSGGAFKFRGTSDWAVNYGSDLADGKLAAGAGNIPVSLEADYAITLDLSHPNEYTYSANSWGIIGDATAGGWDSDQNMTWDAANQVFTATIDLGAGEMKFRANDAWTINYGGTDLNALVAGGVNIAISTAGNYTITFNPWTLKATITQN